MYGEAFNAVFFRKELPMLDDAIERSQSIYGPIGAVWHEQKKLWRFPSGGRLRFRPLERVQDAEKYQGQNISDACVEEAGNYPDSKPIDRLNGVLRSIHGVPTQLIMTGNPGGPGQFWIKDRFIDPAPNGMKVLTRLLPNGKEHKYVFIPSKLENNQLLMRNDPDYINRLYLVGSAELVRAWLQGDWNAVEGAFFDCWNSDLILDSFKVPKDWAKFISLDWGSARPFSVGWWAIVTDDFPVQGKIVPRGTLLRYREWYGCSEPNVGLKLTAEEVGKGIAERGPEAIKYAVADPATFAEDGGPSIIERLGKAYRANSKNEIYFRRADNKRIASQGHLGGWDQMRQRMNENMIYCFSTCTDSIRTIPVLQHDLNRPEDLDTASEDHAADEWRYACMSRPITPKVVKIKKQPIDTKPTLNELMKTKPRIKSKRI